MVKVFLALIFFSHVVISQDEKPANNSDLRYGKTIFVYKSLAENLNYTFNKKNSGESYLYSTKSGLIKLSSSQETEFEPMVVNLFIKIKYQLGDEPKDCTKSWYLEYLGDDIFICSKDQDRIRLVAEIKKSFESIILDTKR